MKNIEFIIGVSLSKLTKGASRTFLLWLTVIAVAVSGYLSASTMELKNLIVPFIQEWVVLGTWENFPAYLMIASYVTLLLASVAHAASVAYDLSFALRTRYGIRIVP